MTRPFLRALKIATESRQCVVSDPKFCSAGVDLLDIISVAFENIQLLKNLIASLGKFMVEVCKLRYSGLQESDIKPSFFLVLNRFS